MNLYELTYGTPRIVRHRLASPVKGLRIGYISDVHLTRYRLPSITERVIRPLAAEQPDIILFGGDYAETRECEKLFFETVSCLNPPLGMFAVLGNNDKERYGSAFPLLRREAAACGITLLINEERRVDTPRGAIMIGGSDEAKYGLTSAKGFFNGGADALKLLICHYPGSAKKLAHQASLMPDLILSGHTHGGQISPFGLNCYALGFEKIYSDNEYFMVSGEKRIPDGPLMIVSNGVGESRMPLRIGAPRQIHIIETV